MIYSAISLIVKRGFHKFGVMIRGDIDED